MCKSNKYLDDWITENKLLNVTLKNPENGKVMFIGRLIKYDIYSGNALIYVDDSKSLENLVLSNIEDIKLAV